MIDLYVSISVKQSIKFEMSVKVRLVARLLQFTL